MEATDVNVCAVRERGGVPCMNARASRLLVSRFTADGMCSVNVLMHIIQGLEVEERYQKKRKKTQPPKNAANIL